MIQPLNASDRDATTSPSINASGSEPLTGRPPAGRRGVRFERLDVGDQRVGETSDQFVPKLGRLAEAQAVV